MQFDLFQFIDNLFQKKELINSKVPYKETFMTIKFLSLYPGTFITAVEANRLSAKIPYWATNMFLFNNVEKQRAPRFSYPKKEVKGKAWPAEAVQKITRRYCCSTEHAAQILSIMERNNPNVLESLGIGKQGTERKKKGKSK